MSVTLSAINIYPVKGLKGIALQSARCTDRGLEHDRRWLVVDSAGVFLSQREHPKMATVWTEIGDTALTLSAPDADSVDIPLQGEASPSLRDSPLMKVQVWNSSVDAAPVSGAADAWLSDYLGFQCRLVVMPESSERYSNPRYAGSDKKVSFADGYAFLVIGEASLADLNAKLAAKSHPKLPMNRFRPNLVVTGSTAYAEDGWKDFRIGSAAFRGVKPCGRCQVTTTDQSTGEVLGPEPLATLSTYRDSSEFGVMFGMNLVSVAPGAIRVGDVVEFS